jgi:nitroimidazol reductase NimA-like FMN-containing flavoprotein (pyridoxamine 5'-phosphate oxidase superfamily)
MRRKEREITDRKEMEIILNEAQVLRLAMVDDGEPYLVAMNYAYADGCIYMHSAREGKKIDILKKDGRVAFQTDIGAEIVIFEEAFRCSTKYKSVYGKGRAVLIDEKGEKKKVLDCIMERYTGRTGLEYPDEVMDMMVAIRVNIETMTGKKSGYQP